MGSDTDEFKVKQEAETTPFSLNSTPEATNNRRKWHALHLLNFYRFTLAAIFFGIITLDPSPSVFGKHDPTLFFYVSAMYILTSILHGFTIHYKIPSFTPQVYFQVILDILLIVLLMHASGSIQSGLGTLLIVTIAAAASLLSKKRSSILIAAIATIFILLEQSYIVIYQIPISINFSQAGVLGTALFVTAIIAQFLVKRIQESEALAQQRGDDLEKMEVLADYIVQRMQTGIVVVDPSLHIRLINDSAKHLLNIDKNNSYHSLEELSPELSTQLRRSRLHRAQSEQIIRPTQDAAEFMPRFAELGKNNSGGTLIFLEDTAALSQQAQQLKLASLGRLTASIAHEIRNPLGAISHAAQLLAESEDITPGDERMLQIIINHSRRMNTIIENVLQLSRRQAPEPQAISINEWLQDFVEEFSHTHNLAPMSIECNTRASFTINFDPTQLQQVLWNLCSNALRYTQEKSDGVRVTINPSLATSSTVPCLDIIDYGPGIDNQYVDNIFEPFFTTDNKGTGLGLYIARELCESNQARLSYLKTADNLSCFRITFSDTRRMKTY